MRAIVIEAHCDADALRVRDLAEPVPAAGEVLVRNRAVGVNFVDLQHRAGSPYPVELPLVPGTEAAGEIVAVGAGVDPALVGAQVAHFGHLAGVYAEFTAVPERFVRWRWPAPRRMCSRALPSGSALAMWCSCTPRPARPAGRWCSWRSRRVRA